MCNVARSKPPIKMDMEFKIGDTVTLDRYNHIDDVQKVKIINIREGFLSPGLVYVMDVNRTEITSTGVSIMESKDYKPVSNKDRHYKEGSTIKEIEEYWKLKNMKP